MHDPDTLVATLKLPYTWRRSRHGRFIDAWDLARVWHRDPCKGGGGDDSCGWFAPGLTEEDCEWARKQAKENKEWFGRTYETIHMRDADDLAVLYAVWVRCRAHVTGMRYLWKPVGPRDLCYVLSLVSNCSDGLQHSIRESRKGSPEALGGLFRCTLRCYRRLKRPWWRHPRWHVHHWRLDVPAFRWFMRRVVIGCAHCGGSFWAEEPFTSPRQGEYPHRACVEAHDTAQERHRLEARRVKVADSSARDAAFLTCAKAPMGWRCSRIHGHEGPCAAHPLTEVDGRIVAEVFGRHACDPTMPHVHFAPGGARVPCPKETQEPPLSCPFNFADRACGWVPGQQPGLPEGCDKTLADCKAHGNVERFGGFPGIPKLGRPQAFQCPGCEKVHPLSVATETARGLMCSRCASSNGA